MEVSEVGGVPLGKPYTECPGQGYGFLSCFGLKIWVKDFDFFV